MNKTAQKVCIWMGPVMCVGWIAGFLIAHYLPPTAPGASAQAVQHLFVHHTFRIRLGMVFVMLFSALLVPFSAVIAAQMRRIEGRHEVLATTQLASGALLSVEFIIPAMVWLAAAYRPASLDPQTLRLMDDLGWILFVAVISSVLVQTASIAFAILLDKSDKPVFPRWAGYLNAWVTVGLSPTPLIVFFHRGVFSWDGAIAFFIPLTVYCVWMVTMTVLLYRAVNEQTEAETEVDTTLEARIAALERERDTRVLLSNR
jgi:hypothetical protein